MPSTRIRQLANAPVKEAVIDLRVQLPASVTFDSFQGFSDLVGGQYPTIKVLRRFGVELAPKKATARALGNEPIGYGFWSADESKVIQCGLWGFAHNVLRPYSSWPEFLGEAMEWWGKYVEQIVPPLVIQVGLKYTNRLLLPEFELQKYLNFLPSSPKGVEGEVTKFVQQVELATSSQIKTTVLVGVEQNLDEGRLPVILDIDLRKEVSLLPDDPEITRILESMHDLKNDIFFENVTDAALALWS